MIIMKEFFSSTKNLLMEIHKRAIKLIKAGDASIELLQLRDSSAEAVKVMHQTLLYINKFVADSELRYLIYTH